MSAKIPTAAEIRATFLDFFKSKQHTIVPSDNVGYTSRDGARIFTNAGMNQFVPIFLGERSADVDTWPGVLAKGLPTRAADTQKCIRAGGKHNDLEDVGLDTYHHTFFEMLGNWSFGDYFKKEAIAWSWELIVERFKFPPSRVFATIYQPNKEKGDPAERDEESWNLWAEKFRSVGLDPDIHIVNGNKKDNFWMMADTGPCGPCTEIHIDLTPGPIELPEDRQREGAKLVNGSDASCIEIWNNVFIQYNANPDGTFTPLPAQHVDTGMGFERLTSIIQGTKNFTDFETAKISNYDTDVFKPIFDELTKLSGKHYQSTLPKANEQGHVIPVTEQEKIDVAFRVIADHLRTLSFSIADGIQPGNSDRNYTLRRILRRAVKYGRTLEFKEPFFYKLVDVLAAQMAEVFPELRVKKEQVKAVLKLEEEAFNRTLDRGVALFEDQVGSVGSDRSLSGAFAFQLYDTFGFPIDLTELLARERGLTVDTAGFDTLMEEQKKRAREAGQKNKQVVSVSEIETKDATQFIGYDTLETDAKANSGIMQLFGEKYPENVRVVQIGGKAHALDGWSMELCGGTHTRHTGEIGLFRLVAEGAVAAGVRRIEAIAGMEAYHAAKADADLLKLLAGKVSAQGAADLEKKIEALLDHQKALEKALKAAQQREASGRAKELIATAQEHVIIANLGDVDADYAMALNDALKGQFGGIVILAATGGGNVTLMANVGKEHQAKVQAGKIIQTIAPIVGGKGGGKPDFARGGGKEVSKVDAALAEARKLIG